MKVRFPLAMLTALVSGAALLPGPEQAVAQTAADALLEEVVVTARRREESLEDLPISVVALSAEVLRAQGIYNTKEISDFAANLSLSESDQRGRHEIFIRGIGSGGPQGSTTVAGAGMYLDGHYLSSQFNSTFSTIDIERVEVLRGPQGTLFGKNVTGGAVNIITRKPQEEFEAELSLRAGDYGQQDLRGMVNVPFSDNLYGRFTVASEQSDGWVHNRFLNQKVDWTDTQSLRGALRYVPNDNWTIDFSASAGKRRDGQNASSCRVRPNQELIDAIQNLHPGGFEDGEVVLPAMDPAVLALHPTPAPYTGPVFEDGVGSDFDFGGGPEPLELAPGVLAVIGGTEELLYSGATYDFWDECNTDTAMGDFVTSDERAEFTNTDDESLTFSAEWNGGAVGSLDNLRLQFNASYRDSDYWYLVDLDNTPFDLKNQSINTSNGIRTTTRSTEFILDADVNDQLSFLLGLYTFSELNRNGTGRCWDLYVNQFLPNQGSDPSIPCAQDQFGTVFEGKAVIGEPAFTRASTGEDESVGVFGHLTYALNDDWTLDFGARWTEDDREFRILEVEFDCVLVDPQLGCVGDPVISAGTIANTNQNSGTFDEVTPMVSLTRNLAGGDAMVYFLYSEGFLTGGFNDEFSGMGDPFLEPLVTFGPETVKNYEVGYKTTLADGRVRLAADVFYMDYSDKQEELEIENPSPIGEGELDVIANASSAEVYGIELELRSSPWDGGFLTVDASYLSNEYDEFMVADVEAILEGDPNAPPLDLSNTRISNRSPEWTLNVSVGHTFLLGNGAQLTPQFGVYAQDDYEFLTGVELTDAPSFCHQDSYSKARARITYVPPGERWEASLYGSNITDERYLADCKTEDPSGTYVVRWDPPQRWGLEFVARW